MRRSRYIETNCKPLWGVWSSTGCNGCLLQDTLDITKILTPSISLTYKISSNVGGATCTSEKTINVTKGSPKADFEIQNGCVGQTAQITNKSSGAQTYEWSVNNSGTVDYTEFNPNGIALTPGTFTLTLKAKTGICEQATSRTINVTTPPDRIKIVSDKLSGCSPLIPNINLNANERSDVEYNWEINSQSFSNNYNPGVISLTNLDLMNKTYSLKVTNSNACASYSDEIILTVFPGVKAGIGIDSTIYRCGATNVKFTDKSIGKTGNSLWDFGDGQTVFTQQDTISHYFLSSDSTIVYQIKQIVKNQCNNDSATVKIEVYPERVNPFFTMSKSEVCVGETLLLKDATTPNPNNWSWYINNQKVGIFDSLRYVFPKADDSYSIKLVAKTTCGTDSLIRSIRVNEAPKSDFQLNKIEICLNETISVENLSSGDIRSFKWTFPDSSIDSLAFQPDITSNKTGKNSVRLDVYGDTKACSTWKELSFEVYPLPETPFISRYDTSDICEGDFIVLVPQNPKGNTDYYWYLNDSLAHAGIELSEILKNGIYTVKLKAVSKLGCVDSLEKEEYLSVNSCQLAVPEVFTPNDDGHSDYFYVTATKGIQKIELLRIRNRWGEIVFEKETLSLTYLLKDGTVKWGQ